MVSTQLESHLRTRNWHSCGFRNDYGALGSNFTLKNSVLLNLKFQTSRHEWMKFLTFRIPGRGIFGFSAIPMCPLGLPYFPVTQRCLNLMPAYLIWPKVGRYQFSAYFSRDGHSLVGSVLSLVDSLYFLVLYALSMRTYLVRKIIPIPSTFPRYVPFLDLVIVNTP